jgi:hypothetical protein
MLKREYKIADPHTPKFRKKRYDILNNSNMEFYTGMKKKYPQLEYYLDSDIAKCIEAFNKRIAKEIIDNRSGVRLSEGLGIIVAGACKLSSETADNNIDQKKSKDLGVPIKHINYHSDKYVMKLKYTNELDRHMFDNHHLWCFDGSRPLSRSLAAEIKKEGGYKKYIVFTTKHHISHLFRKQKVFKQTVKSFESKEKRLLEHDEFGF